MATKSAVESAASLEINSQQCCLFFAAHHCQAGRVAAFGDLGAAASRSSSPGQQGSAAASLCPKIFHLHPHELAAYQ